MKRTIYLFLILIVFWQISCQGAEDLIIDNRLNVDLDVTYIDKDSITFNKIVPANTKMTVLELDGDFFPIQRLIIKTNNIVIYDKEGQDLEDDHIKNNPGSSCSVLTENTLIVQ